MYFRRGNEREGRKEALRFKVIYLEAIGDVFDRLKTTHGFLFNLKVKFIFSEETLSYFLNFWNFRDI